MIISAMLAATSVVGWSQQAWTYADCVDYARAHNISLQKMRLNETTAEIDLEESKAQWQPTLDFATSHGYTNSPWGEDRKNFYNGQVGVNAGWTVWNGGVRENTIKRDELQTQISRLNTDDAFRTLETDLLQVYFNILYARESIGIYREAVELSKAQAERSKALMEAGRVSRVDYSQLQSQYMQDSYALVNAQGTYEERLMELKRLLELGLDSGLTIAEVEWTAEQVLASLPPMDESYRLAVMTDLQLKSLDLAKQSSEVDVDIAKAGNKPRIALSAGVSTGYSAPGGDGFGTQLKRGLNESIGLTLSIPIFDQKKTKSAVARARVQQLNSQLDMDQRYTDLAQIVEKWYIDTRSAQSRFTAAQEQLSAAELTNELTNEQFALGLVNPVDLMMAHNDLIEAQHTLLQSKYMAMLGKKMIDYYRTATVTMN